MFSVVRVICEVLHATSATLRYIGVAMYTFMGDIIFIAVFHFAMNMIKLHLPKSRWNSSSLAHTTQWMGLSGVLRIVHTG